MLDEERWGQLKSIVDGFSNYLPKMTIKQVQGEYIRVFGHAVSMECPPYEMQYGTEGGVQSQTDVLIQLGGFFETFGFELPRNQSKERIDHISNELAFMSYMCFRMAYGIQNGHDERKVGVLLSGMKKFIRNHVGRWMPLFCIFASRKAERGVVQGYCRYSFLSSLKTRFPCWMLIQSRLRNRNTAHYPIVWKTI